MSSDKKASTSSKIKSQTSRPRDSSSLRTRTKNETTDKPVPVKKKLDSSTTSKKNETVSSKLSKIKSSTLISDRSSSYNEIQKTKKRNISNDKNNSSNKSNSKEAIKTVDKETKHNFVKNTPLNVTVNSPVKKKRSVENDTIDSNSKIHKRYLTRTLDPEEIQVAHSSDVAKQNFDALNNISKALESQKTIHKINSAFFVPMDKPKIDSIQNIESDINYEDDFEDYESDFETNSTTKNTGGSSEDIEDISSLNETDPSKEINQENIKQDSLKYVSLTDEGFDECSGGFPSSSFSGLYTKRTAFSSTLKENKDLIKSQKRAADLLNLITLDKIQYTLFDMAPIDYDTFIKTFGQSNNVQGSCQTNDDNIDKIEQTDFIDVDNKWTQNPLLFSPYDIITKKETKKETYMTNKSKHKKISAPQNVIEIKKLNNPLEIYQVQKNCCSNQQSFVTQNNEFSMGDLTTFVKKAAEMISIQLEKNIKPKINRAPIGQNLEFGKLSKSVSVDSFKDTILEERPPKILKMSENSTKYFMTVHDESRVASQLLCNSSIETVITNRSLICLWHKDSIAEPYKVLVTSGIVRSCVLLEELDGIIAVGLENGIMCSWDLNSKKYVQDTIHYRKMNSDKSIKTNEFLFKFSTFDTSHEIFQSEKNWNGPLIAIGVKEKPFIKNENIIQLVTLHEFGTLTLWNVKRKIEFAKYSMKFDKIFQISIDTIIDVNVKFKNKSPFDDSDLDVITKNHWKEPVQTNNQSGFICKNVYYIQTDNTGHLLVLYDSNKILHYLENGQRGKPSHYKSEDTWIEMCTIESNKKFWPYFLVGCSNSIIYLFSIKNILPLKVFDASHSMTAIENAFNYVCWSNKRPGVFIGITNDGHVVVWDLIGSDLFPIHTDKLDKANFEIQDVSLFEDTKNPQLVFMSTSEIIFYAMNSNISTAKDNEDFIVQKYLKNI